MNKFDITLGGESHVCAPLTAAETVRASRIISAARKNTDDLDGQAESLVQIAEIVAAALCRAGSSSLDLDGLLDVATPSDLIAAIVLLVRRSYLSDQAAAVN